MTRRLIRIDRFLVLLLGLALVAACLLVLDWEYHLLLDLAGPLDAGVVTDLTGTAAWPWAFAATSLILGLLGLWWLLAHLRRPGAAPLRLSASDERGRLQADVQSVATAAAHHLADHAPVVDVTGTTRTHGAATLVELRGHVDPAAAVTSIVDAADECSDQVRRAFPGNDVTCRVVLDAPRRPRRGRADRVRVQ